MTDLLTFHDNLPLSLYIHLPWCVRKCPYCDFNSHEAVQNPEKQLAYVDALLSDLEYELPRIWGRRINTVFIGGGTPSLFTEEAMARLLAGLRARLNLRPEIEISLEANPGTAEAHKFYGFRELGINRISIGVQSFNNDSLKALGRIHDAGEAAKAINMAQAAEFDHINIDLMFGLPGQTAAGALEDLQEAVDYGTGHISWYQLTIEPNTVFYSKPPQLPEEDLIWKMQQAGAALLAEHAYDNYEISAWSRPGEQCLHNLNYWQFGDYLGIGAGAHSKLTQVGEGSVSRYARHRLPERYMQLAGTAGAIVESRKLNPSELGLEFMMNILRLKAGVPSALFLQRTGLPINAIQSELQNAEEQGLLEWDISTLRPTEKGQRYLNDLLQYFMPDTETA